MNNDGINVVANRSVRHQELRLLDSNKGLIGIMSSKKAFDLAQLK